MIYIPKISPIRIKQVVNVPFPAQDLGAKFVGVDYVNFCNEIPVGVEFIFQFMCDTSSPSVDASGNTVTLTDITPTGWVGLGNYVFEASYAPTSTTPFKFYLSEGGYYFESVEIQPVEDVSKLIKIAYANTENDFLYVDGSVLVSYFTAEYRLVQPQNELTVYQNDRGELTKLRATPLESYELHFYHIPYYVVNQLNLIFSCDIIGINDEGFQTEEVISAEAIEMSNIFNATVVITRTDDDYEFFTITNDGIEFIEDGTSEMITDDNLELIY
jgi:hypothetical protein